MTKTKKASSTSKKLAIGILAVIFLTLCLCITTYALVTVSVSVSDNYFKTGNVSVDLNGGKPVIEEHEFLFEPGMTVTKEFYIENTGTWDIYYKLYMDDVSGGLATVLRITVSDGDRTLYQGTAAELSRERINASDDTLRPHERRILTISFYYPPESVNSTQNLSLSFDLCAEAVQTKNNPNKLFE